MFKSIFKKNLRLNMIKNKFKVSKIRRKGYMKFRIEDKGSYVDTFYMGNKDSVLTLRMNSGYIIYTDSKVIVLIMENRMLCIISE